MAIVSSDSDRNVWRSGGMSRGERSSLLRNKVPLDMIASGQMVAMLFDWFKQAEGLMG
jgi:hypothetical protein